MPQPIVISTPGSAMLFGEHAVLRGFPCIVAAIDCRLQLRFTPRIDQVITVTSALGIVTTTLSHLSFGPSFRYIEAVFRLYAAKLSSGASIEIISEINPLVGLASSASVTVALLAALQKHLFGFISHDLLLQQSCQVIQSVQGFGSGADAASIIHGGIISYNASTLKVNKLCDFLPLVLVYSGAKKPTSEVIHIVNEAERTYPRLYKAIFTAISENCRLAISAIKKKQLDILGILMNQAQGLMSALGVNTPKITSIWLELIEQSSIYGAKISGSGLGDSVVALGTSKACKSGPMIPANVSIKGLILDD